MPGSDRSDAGAAQEPGTPHPRREKAFLRGATLGLLAVGLVVAWPLRTPILLALVTAFIAHRPYEWLARRMPKRLAAAIALVGVAVILLAPLAALGTLLAREVVAMAGQLQEQGLGSTLSAWAVGAGVPPEQAGPAIDAALDRAASYVVGLVVPALEGTLALIVALVVFFILLYYLLLDGRALVAFLQRMLPMPPGRMQRLTTITGERTHALVYGTVAAAAIQGVLAGLGWWILGMPSPLFWGFVMLVMAVLPVLGAFVVLLPGALWAFLQGDYVAAVGLLILNFVIVGLVDDLVRPYLIGKRSQVHTSLVLIGLIGGVLAFGISGLILGPLVLGLVPPFLQAWMEPGEGTLDEPVPEAEG